MAIYFVEKAERVWRKSDWGEREPEDKWVVTQSKGYWHKGLESTHKTKEEAIEAAKEKAKEFSKLDSLWPGDDKERAIVQLGKNEKHIATYEGGIKVK